MPLECFPIMGTIDSPISKFSDDDLAIVATLIPRLMVTKSDQKLLSSSAW